MAPHTYKPPVDALLHYGECQGFSPKDWPNYVQELSLTADHVPALIQMAQDEQLWAFFESDYEREVEFQAAGIDPDEALWAPIHAWRSLGQLQAAEAIAPLAEVLQRYDFDWCWEEIPQVFGLIGEAAIAPLEELLATKISYNTKIFLVGGFGRIAETFPELRDRCVEALTRQLSQYKHHHRSVNGALVTELFKLKATEPESLAAMEAAYSAKKVDEMFVGSWPRVQVDLGLRQESDFTAEELAIHYTPQQEEMMANIKASLEQPPLPPSQRLPKKLGAYGLEKPPEFKDIAAQRGSKKLPEKSGFGGGAASGSKKRAKKKK
ncbi:hypothetical protein [Nodosilinea nodulosa]|uniref:hypothetical protein n=1 Tax=Nodosilinea nodulosa TaxID=416001 RepID=UPI00030E754A|nr:hypothetical protein [Nodosilinea nodulosa]